MDALSDVLRVIRLSGGVFLEAEFTAPWCVSGRVGADDCRPYLMPPRHVIAFHFVATGCMQLQAEDGEPMEVVAMVLGDAYQRAVLGISEEGDSEAFAQQIAAAIAYALGWRA